VLQVCCSVLRCVAACCSQTCDSLRQCNTLHVMGRECDSLRLPDVMQGEYSHNGVCACVLQCVAESGREWQCVAVNILIMWCVRVCVCVCTAVCCSELQRVAVCCSEYSHNATARRYPNFPHSLLQCHDSLGVTQLPDVIGEYSPLSIGSCPTSHGTLRRTVL